MDERAYLSMSKRCRVKLIASGYSVKDPNELLAYIRRLVLPRPQPSLFVKRRNEG